MTSGMFSHSFPAQRHSHLASSCCWGAWPSWLTMCTRWGRHTPSRLAPAHRLWPRGCSSQITARTKAAWALDVGGGSLLSRNLMKYRCPLSLTRSTCIQGRGTVVPDGNKTLRRCLLSFRPLQEPAVLFEISVQSAQRSDGSTVESAIQAVREGTVFHQG